MFCFTSWDISSLTCHSTKFPILYAGGYLANNWACLLSPEPIMLQSSMLEGIPVIRELMSPLMSCVDFHQASGPSTVTLKMAPTMSDSIFLFHGILDNVSASMLDLPKSVVNGEIALGKLGTVHWCPVASSLAKVRNIGQRVAVRVCSDRCYHA